VPKTLKNTLIFDILNELGKQIKKPLFRGAKYKNNDGANAKV
jgi:hypothetical protein